MSSYDPAAQTVETETQRQLGEGAFLSAEERRQVQRLFGFPEEFPRTFGAWIQDYMAINGQFGTSQIIDLNRLIYAKGTTLPEDPAKDQFFSLDLGGGFVWNFRYNQGSPSADKWEFTGGPPLLAFDAGTHSTSSSSYNGSGPTVTVPLSGEYMVEISLRMTVAGADSVHASYTIGAAGASDNDAVSMLDSSGNNPLGGSRKTYKSALVAGEDLSMRYRNQSNVNNVNFSNRLITLTPIRVR